MYKRIGDWNTFESTLALQYNNITSFIALCRQKGISFPVISEYDYCRNFFWYKEYESDIKINAYCRIEIWILNTGLYDLYYCLPSFDPDNLIYKNYEDVDTIPDEFVDILEKYFGVK